MLLSNVSPIAPFVCFDGYATFYFFLTIPEIPEMPDKIDEMVLLLQINKLTITCNSFRHGARTLLWRRVPRGFAYNALSKITYVYIYI